MLTFTEVSSFTPKLCLLSSPPGTLPLPFLCFSYISPQTLPLPLAMAVSISGQAKLTPALFQIFRRYKKATSAVIQWLATASDNHGEDCNNSAWSLGQLLRAAEFIHSHNIGLPEDIFAAFTIAINAREKISSHFKQLATANHESTRSHEHFTNT